MQAWDRRHAAASWYHLLRLAGCRENTENSNPCLVDTPCGEKRNCTWDIARTLRGFRGETLTRVSGDEHPTTEQGYEVLCTVAPLEQHKLISVLKALRRSAFKTFDHYYVLQTYLTVVN